MPVCGAGEGGLEVGAHGYAVGGAFVEEAVVGGVGVVEKGWGEDGFEGGEGGGMEDIGGSPCGDYGTGGFCGIASAIACLRWLVFGRFAPWLDRDLLMDIRGPTHPR